MPDLNNYRLIKRLSTGLIDTFIAENIGSNGDKYSVVKVFNLKDFSQQQKQYLTALLTQTVAVIFKLQPHSQITSIVSYFEQYSSFYIVENYINGHGLEVEITLGKRLSESYAIAFLQNTLIPLDWLHQQNVVHGNIHPANLMRRQQDGKIILTDIGTVKQVWRNAIAAIKPQPLMVNDTNYLPPGYPLDRRTFDSDIYGLGAIAIQALIGLPIEQLINYQSRELILPRQLQVERAFANLLQKMVFPDERERFSSAREVLIALEKVKESVKVTSQATINVGSHNGSGNNQYIVPDRSTETTAIASPMPKKSIGQLSLIAWVSANFAGISLGFYLSWVLAYLGSILFAKNSISLVFGLSFGLILGTCQGLVIKGIIQRGFWWIVLTTIGSILGFFVGNLGANIWGVFAGAILGGIVGAIAGLPQSAILRSQLGKGSGWWLINAIAGAICGLIATIIPGWGIAIGSIIFGIITGIFLR